MERHFETLSHALGQYVGSNPTARLLPECFLWYLCTHSLKAIHQSFRFSRQASKFYFHQFIASMLKITAKIWVWILMNSHISFLHISTIQLTIAGSKRVKNPSELSYFVYTDTNLWQIPGITVIHDVPEDSCWKSHLHHPGYLKPYNGLATSHFTGLMPVSLAARNLGTNHTGG